MDPDDLREVLHASTEALNEVLLRAEKGFFDMRLGVAAEVYLEEGVMLSFRRVDKKWGLCVVTEAKDSAREVTLILSATRHHRVLAAAQLGALHEAIVQEAEKLIVRMREAIEILEPFVDALEKSNAATV